MNVHNELNLAELAASAFTGLFGDPLDLWVCQQGVWHHSIDILARTSKSQELETAFVLPESLPKTTAIPTEPVVEEVGDGIFRIGVELVIPDEWSRSRAIVFAYGTVRSNLQTLVRAVCRLTNEKQRLLREVDEGREGLGPHLEQISHDFEELTWLRRLAGKANYSDVTTPLIDLAETVMHDLCTLIRAESLVLVSPFSADNKSDLGGRVVGSPVVWIGERLLSDNDCTQLIESLINANDAGRPVVRNHLDQTQDGDAYSQIHSCVMHPVRFRGTSAGWLLALNRVPLTIETAPGEEPPPVRLSDREFGTADAGLMNSAAATIAAHARNIKLFQEKESLLIGIIRALVNSIDAKDSYTCGHSDRVAMMAKCIGERIELSSVTCESLYMAGLLHDIGKIGVPDEVLLKPGKLTDEEFAIIKKHPVIGHSILSHLPQLKHVLPGVLHHHESYDGRGYPHGLVGEEIPLFGRILAIADSYDAMTSCRPYRTAMPTEKAEGILTKGAGTQWDPLLVEAFFESLPQIKQMCQDSSRRVEELLQIDTPESESHSSTQDRIAFAISLTNS